MRLVEVCVNLAAKGLDHTFTYLLPDALAADVGWRVLVPFAGRLAEGFILKKYEGGPGGRDLKAVARTLGGEPWFDRNMLCLAAWLSDYYLCTMAEAMRLFLPGKKSTEDKFFYYLAGGEFLAEGDGYAGRLAALLRAEGRAGRGRIKRQLGFFDQAAIDELVRRNVLARGRAVEDKFKEKLAVAVKPLAGLQDYLAGHPGCRAARKKAAEILMQNPGGLLADDLKRRGVALDTLKRMRDSGLVAFSSRQVARDSYSAAVDGKEPVVLSEEQETAADRVRQCVKEGAGGAFLLYGVTGSGKTEVYLDIAETVYRKGGQTLLLTPEIALTGQLVRRFKERFPDSVLVFHSRLSLNERMDVFAKIKKGGPFILIGARSALFAPFAALGAVIVDEEHEYSYKQEERPCYHARTVAEELARINGVPLVLGSATPSLESYYKALNGEYFMLRLEKRPGQAVLPEVVVADMSKEIKSGNKGVLSSILAERLRLLPAKNEQAIVLLNRRGFATFVLCRDCGYVERCEQCAVSLVYHQEGGLLRCHYCGYTKEAPAQCPQCRSRRIRFFGSGTQKAQTQLAELMPSLRVIRMDQDTTGRKMAHDKILDAFRRGEYDLLLGTQMVAKGHDIQNVTLVGVLAADALINLPDFRAGERAFALLTQAAGRAGRGAKKGTVVLQAYEARHPVIEYVRRQDYAGFAGYELKCREELFYPPYSCVIKIGVAGKTQRGSAEKAAEIFRALKGISLPAGRLEINGPFPGMVEKVRGLYKMLIIVKTDRPDLVKNKLSADWSSYKDAFIDVDPLSVI
ncbi:MAG: primosomal protein N' [Acidaminococcales bacterium]|nr:primosomal protein N' [Acidaminococcales bacterium]